MRPWTVWRELQHGIRTAAASMGPRPCGRGRVVVAVDRGRGARASMGPRPCGRGRTVLFDTRRRDESASMGPRPCGRGRVRAQHGLDRLFLLQWGHGLAAVDGAAHPVGPVVRPGASMGPRPCGRGRQATWFKTRPCIWSFNGATALRPWTARARRVEVRPPRASMGPRPCGRGR